MEEVLRLDLKLTYCGYCKLCCICIVCCVHIVLKNCKLYVFVLCILCSCYVEKVSPGWDVVFTVSFFIYFCVVGVLCCTE